MTQDTGVTLTASANSSSRNFSLTVQAPAAPPTVSSLTCVSNQLSSGQSTTCTVTLNKAVSSGSQSVALSKSGAAVTMPSSISISSGGSSGTFTATGGSVTQDTAVTLTASANGGSGTFTVTVKAPDAPPALSSLACGATELSGGQSTNCTVGLTKAADSGGMQITLSKTAGALTMPGSVTVPQGDSSAGFAATAGQINSDTPVTVTATAGGVTRTANITLKAPAIAPVSLSSLACSPLTVAPAGSSVCSVTLTGAAPSTGFVVSLSSNNSEVAVPGSITVQSGATSAGFSASAGSGASGTAQVTAQAGGVSKTALLTITSSGPLNITSLSCSPPILTGGGTSLCTVRVSPKAPAGGAAITVAVDHPLLHAPGAVAVDGGGTSAQFEVSSGLIVSDGTALVRASAESSSKTTNLSLIGIRPLALSCSPSQVAAGSSTNCEITLNSGQVEQDINMTIRSSHASVTVPSSILVRAKQERVSFRANVAATATPQTVTLTAVLGNATVTDQLVILSTLAPVLTVPGPQVVIFQSVLEFLVTAVDPSRGGVTMSVSGMPTGAKFNQTGEFSWKPNKSQIGTYTLTFKASNSLGLSSTADVTITVVTDTPIVGGLVNSASYSTDLSCSPGGLASIFGTGFTRQDPSVATTLPLPTVLSGVRVKINDKFAPLLYASGTQVNLQCPLLAADTPLVVTLESDLGTSQPVKAVMQHATPGIFSLTATGSGQGAVVVARTGQVAMVTNAGIPSAPAQLQDFISIYATGLGPVNTEVTPGEPAPLGTPSTLLSDIQVAIGDVFGELQFAGLAPGFVGLYQVNAKIPTFAPVGDQIPVSLRVRFPDGRIAESNKVNIAISKK